ncbi:MAG TPA: class I SAM-dependent rRNA methyltransferase [Candidatus Wunengus sp. YC61]|uniref:class I SAM-dependent rRNA methyltransferase n=1 Tax=Candidatus Wunengus sp. YC61 TaxID=3367698 RepID=UPI004027B02D
MSLRKKYIDLTTTNVYRLVNSYGDALPEVTIDVYDKNLLVQYFKSYEIQSKDRICNDLKDILAPESITEKTRLKGEDIKTHLVSGKGLPGDFVVTENGIKFNISFLEGGGTGLFLDQRDNRKKIQAIAKGKEILNCFCYTSSFSIYAKIGGATRTTNIDLSKKAIEWSKNNFLLNQLDVNDHEFIVGDVWEWLRRFQKKGRTFDVIIIDPPSFSTSKTTVFTAEKDIPGLIAAGLDILREDGILAFSTNIAKINFSKFFQLLSRVKDFTKKTYKLIDVSSQGLDFPTDGVHVIEPYLKFVMLSC